MTASFQQTVAFIDEAIEKVEKSFEQLGRHVEKPARPERETVLRYEHKQKTLALACYLKLARIVSALNVVRLLLPKGMFQECGVLIRTLVDFSDEIAFLALKPPGAEVNIEKFLTDFYLDSDVASLGWKAPKRDVLSRRKIHAALARSLQLQQTGNPQQLQDAGYAISDTFSMFVHGSYSAIMDMYDDPTVLRIDGSRSKYLHAMWMDQMLVTLPRALQSTAHVALLVGAGDLTKKAFEDLRGFETRADSFFLLP